MCFSGCKGYIVQTNPLLISPSAKMYCYTCKKSFPAVRKGITYKLLKWVFLDMMNKNPRNLPKLIDLLNDHYQV